MFSALFEARGSDTKQIDLSLSGKISWCFEIVFFVFLFVLIISGNLSSNFLLVVSLSIVHLIFLSLGLAPKIINHLRMQRRNRENENLLKSKNLAQLKKNIDLEQRVSATSFFSELASLDPIFITNVLASVRKKLSSDINKSSMILTKLAKHMRNHVYFHNKSHDILRNELKAVFDFKALCDVLYSTQTINLIQQISIDTSQVQVKSQLILPSLKSIFKAAKKIDDKAIINLFIIGKDLTLDISVEVDSKKEIVLAKEKIGIDLIQSRMLDSGTAYGTITHISDKKMDFTLQLEKIPV